MHVSTLATVDIYIVIDTLIPCQPWGMHLDSYF
jgi:hypothetical protein